MAAHRQSVGESAICGDQERTTLATSRQETTTLARLRGRTRTAFVTFDNQQDRMNYPYYRRKGWCCSSAVIESACKQILGGRIKGSGQRWNVDGANAMITLR